VTYKETLGWMFSQLPMYQKSGATAFKGKLDNIQRFAVHLDNPHTKFKSIHVAGTNGKGSCSHMLAAILQEAGYRVGLYTSPHLKDFRERIKINGTMVSEESVINFIERHQPFLKTHELSFFEMTVGMAFDHFAKEQVDIAIIEVGLGGRLDSTNIILPEVALITNIGYDHMDILGNTLQKIALEKAGVIKSKVPVVLSETQEETKAIFELLAAQKNAPLVFADATVKQTYKTDLLGSYQQKNVKGVVAVIRQLKGLKVSEKAIKEGLLKVAAHTGLLGRWQLLGETPRIVCDTAHNEDGLRQVMRQLQEQNYGHLHMVIGFVKEKQLENLLPLLPKAATYYFVKPKVPRGLDAPDLQTTATKFGLEGTAFESVGEGFDRAKLVAGSNDLIFVGGSTFVVAEVV